MHPNRRTRQILKVARERERERRRRRSDNVIKICVISIRAQAYRTQRMLILSKPKIMSLLFITTIACQLLLIELSISSSVADASQPNTTLPEGNASSTSLSGTKEPSHYELDARDQFKLNCQPGEQRQFSYESSTKVWGSSDQQVRLRAIFRIKCMEPPSNSSLKYLAEIVSVKPNFVSHDEPSLESSKLQQQPSKPLMPKFKVVSSAGDINHSQSRTVEVYARRQVALQQQANSGQHNNNQLRIHEADVDQMLRAEPLLEEVGEAAIRMKRSVSGWFSKAWVSVKDFFGNMFTSSERSFVSRDQVLKESGLDIAGQCKASGSSSSSSSHKGGKGGAGLPFDESVFEDLGPEYYVGASLDGASGLEFLGAGHVSTFDSPGRDQKSTGEDGEDPLPLELMTLSFFDDPPALRRHAGDKIRAKRAPSQRKSRTTGAIDSLDSGELHERLLRVPFVFIQSRSGKIAEIRFSGDETDLSVKNFKRHLCDLFATNLDWNKPSQSEVSPIGKHQTKYTLDASANSMDSMKRTMLDSGGGGDNGNSLSDETANEHEERTNKQQLVRVLATLGTSDRRFLGNDSTRPLTIGTGGIQDDEMDVNVDENEDDSKGEGAQQRPVQKSVSVLRLINTTSSIQQMGSKVALLAHEIDRMQVRVKQVQQINEGRLVGTAGQLSMSLVQMSASGQQQARRNKRQTPAAGRHPEQVEDISHLLRVSTSFSMQLVPIPREPDGSIASEDANDLSINSNRARRSTSESFKKRDTLSDKGRRRSMRAPPVKLAPSDAQELARVLHDWRKQEARLQLSATNLISENNSGLKESQTTRLDILRDQIRQRLNEEFVRNRIRRSLSFQQVAPVAATVAASNAARTSNARSADDQLVGEQKQTRTVPPPSGGDLGLGLTQLVLGTGVTTRRKGSIYGQLEEALELEAQLVQDDSESAISRLMRNTLKMDKLRQHCKSSVASLEELTSGAYLLELPPASGVAGSNLQEYERRFPFGFKEDDGVARDLLKNSELFHRTRASRRARQVEKFVERNDRKLEQCQKMLRLVLKLNEKQAVNLVLELIDECNSQLVAAAKLEELGYGPISKYFRRQRQHFLELLVHVGRPTDLLLDKLLSRLYHYPKLASSTGPASITRRPPSPTGATRIAPSRPESEFVYLTKEQRGLTESTSSGGGKSQFNKSLLREEDDFNNNDGAGLLVMTLTSLAAKSSIGRLKRLEVAEKLLGSLKGTTCSLFSSPDLDIIESMANFQEPLDEIVGRILQLARKCRQHDQYVVACVHGLSGQLRNAGTQRLLGDLLKSPNGSCAVKSEVVLTLIGAQLIDDLKLEQQQQQPMLMPSVNVSQEGVARWPSVGFNQVDEILLELVDGQDKSREPDRRCLGHLVAHYLSKKPVRRQQASTTTTTTTTTLKPILANTGRAEKRSFRPKRAVQNEQNFWDDAQCKRWSMPADGSSLSAPALTHLYNEGADHDEHPSANNSSNNDLIDEIDDNSILSAIINHNNQQQQQHQATRTGPSSRRGWRQQKLIERELDLPAGGPNTTQPVNQIQVQQVTRISGSQQVAQAAVVRRRHKCVASKDFGPKNAQATLKAEIVNDLVGSKDENKFLARFRLATNFLGQRIDVGRMYLWHQRRTTRAYANILGRSIWDSSHGCKDKPPSRALYMPLFDFSLWLVKISVGLRLDAEMGFFPNCDQPPAYTTVNLQPTASNATTPTSGRYHHSAGDVHASVSVDELQLYPTITLRASGEATAKLVVARAGMSLASQYSYQGDIRVSRQPESCMSIYSAHQPMNVTFSSWYQLWDNECHFWGSRSRAEPQATKWRLTGQKPIAWLENECLAAPSSSSSVSGSQRQNANDNNLTSAATARLIPPPPPPPSQISP